MILVFFLRKEKIIVVPWYTRGIAPGSAWTHVAGKSVSSQHISFHQVYE